MAITKAAATKLLAKIVAAKGGHLSAAINTEKQGEALVLSAKASAVQACKVLDEINASGAFAPLGHETFPEFLLAFAREHCTGIPTMTRAVLAAYVVANTKGSKVNDAKVTQQVIGTAFGVDQSCIAKDMKRASGDDETAPRGGARAKASMPERFAKMLAALETPEGGVSPLAERKVWSDKDLAEAVAAADRLAWNLRAEAARRGKFNAPAVTLPAITARARTPRRSGTVAGSVTR